MRAGQFTHALQLRANFQQGTREACAGMACKRSFVTVGQGQHDIAPGACGGEHGRQRAFDGAQLAGQGQLAVELDITQRVARHLSGGREDAERDGQVEAAAVLGHVCRCQIDGDAALWKFQLRALQGGAYTVAAFAHCRIGQPDDGYRRQASGQMHFDTHFRRIDAGLGTTVDEGKRHGGSGQNHPAAGAGVRWMASGWKDQNVSASGYRRAAPVRAPVHRASRGYARARRAALRTPRA